MIGIYLNKIELHSNPEGLRCTDRRSDLEFFWYFLAQNAKPDVFLEIFSNFVPVGDEASRWIKIISKNYLDYIKRNKKW